MFMDTTSVDTPFGSCPMILQTKESACNDCVTDSTVLSAIGFPDSEASSRVGHSSKGVGEQR